MKVLVVCVFSLFFLWGCSPQGEFQREVPSTGGSLPSSSPSQPPSSPGSSSPPQPQGSRVFGTPISLSMGGIKFGMESIAVGDLDGDGKSDIAVSDPDFSAYKTDGKLAINSAEPGKVYVYFGNSLLAKTSPTPDITFTNSFSANAGHTWSKGANISLAIAKYYASSSCPLCEDLWVGDYETFWDFNPMMNLVASGGVYMYKGERLKNPSQNDSASADFGIKPLHNQWGSNCLDVHPAISLGKNIILVDLDGNSRNDLLVNNLKSSSQKDKIFLFDETSLKNDTPSINHCENNGIKETSFMERMFELGKVVEGKETIGVVDKSQGKLELYKAMGRSSLSLVAKTTSLSNVFPHKIQKAGDLDGDGSHDFLVSQVSGQGLVNIYYGFLSRPTSTIIIDLESSFRITGIPNSLFGTDMTVADLNQDGYSDIVIGAPGLKKVFIFYGKSNRWDKPAQSIDLDISHADQILENTKERFGTNIKIADINGDGKHDLIIGAEGAVYIYV